MKKFTCMEIDGICETPIEGKTPDQVLINRMRHLNESVVIYPEHQQVLNKIQLMSENEQQRWNDKFLEKWNNTPDYL